MLNCIFGSGYVAIFAGIPNIAITGYGFIGCPKTSDRSLKIELQNHPKQMETAPLTGGHRVQYWALSVLQCT